MQNSIWLRATITEFGSNDDGRGADASCLMRGQSLKESAAESGIARTTAKTYLGRILSKTGTHRQSDLLALVHRLSPAIDREIAG